MPINFQYFDILYIEFSWYVACCLRWYKLNFMWLVLPCSYGDFIEHNNSLSNTQFNFLCGSLLPQPYTVTDIPQQMF